MKLTGIILAGGKSSRMGQDKGLMIFNGKPMIQHIIDIVNLIADNIIIVANNKDYEQFGYPVYEDLIKEKGPLAGIYTGLQYSKTEKNIILSCDTPFVSEELLQHLVNNSVKFDVTIPEKENNTHQLIGVYSKSCLNGFKSELEADQRKIKIALNKVNLNIVDANKFDNKEFTNLNTAIDIKSL